MLAPAITPMDTTISGSQVVAAHSGAGAHDHDGAGTADNTREQGLQQSLANEGRADIDGQERALVTPVAQAPLQQAAASPAPPSTPGRLDGDCAPPISIRLLAGGPVVMRSRWMKSARSWRWQAGGRALKMTKDSRQGPKHALEQWLVQHAEAVVPDSVLEIRQDMALLEPDVDVTPPTVSTPRRRGTSQPEAQLNHADCRSAQLTLPSLETCEHIVNRGADVLLCCHSFSGPLAAY